MANFELLKELTQAWGVAGREKAVRAIVLRELEGHVDNAYVDNIGNIIAVKHGKGGPDSKKIMLSAHMDEIGLQVKKIESDGRIKVCNVGWVWTSALYNDQVVFQNGTIGVVGCDGKIEDAKNDSGKLYIDIGCTSKEDTEKYVKVGDYAGFVGPWYELQNGRVSAKTFDDRVGCFMLLEAVKRNKGDCPNDVYYVFSVQEEVGCRGSHGAAYGVQPDIVLNLEGTAANDLGCVDDQFKVCRPTQGVAVSFMDDSSIGQRKLFKEILDLAEHEHIPHQIKRGVTGSNDASAYQRAAAGCLTCVLSVPCRYIHSGASVAYLEDIQSQYELVRAFLMHA